MSRRRVAIAHFAETAAAERIRQALLERGGRPLATVIDSSMRRAVCRVEVELSAPVERALLDVLLSSEAVRVDVHDAGHGEAD